MIDNFFQKHDLIERLNKSFDAFIKLLSSIRTGRATPAFLDGVIVDIDGNKSQISHIATVSTMDNSTLSISPWVDSYSSAIYKAIQESDLGINPIKQGRLIIVPLPKLTEERRKELAKVVKQYEEQSKVAIRNIRRDIISELDTLKKNKEIGEDEIYKGKEKVQKLVDDIIKKMDISTEQKIVELMKV